MTSSKKSNQRCFGMKTHIGVDAERGLVHTAGLTAGKVHHAKVKADLVRKHDMAVRGDKAVGLHDDGGNDRPRILAAKCDQPLDQ